MTTVSECRDAAGRHGLEIRGEPTGKRGWKYSLFRKNELLGARQSAGALMNLIKSAVSAEPETRGADELRTVRSAHQAVLAELDRANAEIGSLREALQQREAEISTLKAGLTEDKHSEQRHMDDLLNTDSSQNRKHGIEDALAEILERLSGMERRIGTDGVRTEKRKALNIAGWSVHRDAKGFHRAFRNIRGKVHGVYLGRDISDSMLINTKLTNKYQEITGLNELL